jgi:hypothetical protein
MTNTSQLDPRQIAHDGPSRLSGRVDVAQRVAELAGRARRTNDYQAIATGTQFIDLGAGTGPIGLLKNGAMRRLRGIASVTGSGVTLNSANDVIATVPEPPAGLEIYTQACYIGGGPGLAFAMVELLADGRVRATAIPFPAGITTLAAGSWISLAGIEWRIAT